MILPIRQRFLGLIFLICFLGIPTLSFSAQTPEEIYYEELKKEYIPQDSPEKSFTLELKLLADGMYCYDLALFDPQWRQRGKKILTSNLFKETAQKAAQPFEAYIEGPFAVIYYPQDKKMAPVFLYYQEGQGWILDHSVVVDKVFYSPDGWMCVGGEYPYLNLLKKIFIFKKVPLDDKGFEGYEVEGFN